MFHGHSSFRIAAGGSSGNLIATAGQGHFARLDTTRKLGCARNIR
jgi:hypothetical protein